jgi:hypothetical protein
MTGMANKTKPDQKMREWIDARRRHHLSHAQVQMALELGMNATKLGKLDNHEQEPWKMPLPEYIEHLYRYFFHSSRHCVNSFLSYGGELWICCLVTWAAKIVLVIGVSRNAVSRKQESYCFQPATAVHHHVADLHGFMVKDHIIYFSELTVVCSADARATDIANLF